MNTTVVCIGIRTWEWDCAFCDGLLLAALLGLRDYLYLYRGTFPLPAMYQFAVECVLVIGISKGQDPTLSHNHSCNLSGKSSFLKSIET